MQTLRSSRVEKKKRGREGEKKMKIKERKMTNNVSTICMHIPVTIERLWNSRTLEGVLSPRKRERKRERGIFTI